MVFFRHSTGFAVYQAMNGFDEVSNSIPVKGIVLALLRRYASIALVTELLVEKGSRGGREKKTTKSLLQSFSFYPQISLYVPLFSLLSTGTHKRLRSAAKAGSPKLTKTLTSRRPVLQHKFYHSPLFFGLSPQYDPASSARESSRLSDKSITATSKSSQTIYSGFTAQFQWPMALSPAISQFVNEESLQYLSFRTMFTTLQWICLDHALSSFLSQLLGKTGQCRTGDTATPAPQWTDIKQYLPREHGHCSARSQKK